MPLAILQMIIGKLIDSSQCCSLFIRADRANSAKSEIQSQMTTAPLPDTSSNQCCQACPVRHRAICAALGIRGSHALSDIMYHKHFKCGQPLWADADEAHAVAIVVKGIVKLYKLMADGRQQVVGLLLPSDTIGRPFSEVQLTFAEAATEVEICCFPRKEFERILEQHPELEHALLEKTTKNLDETRDWMLALGRMNAIEKVASFLIMMAGKSNLPKCVHHHPSPNLPTFMLPLRRQEIADCLGLTTETVSRNFTTLRVKGVIKLIDPHTIEIRDLEALSRLVESEG